jgi:hypothetical protein
LAGNLVDLAINPNKGRRQRMSINTIANGAAARRLDIVPLGVVPKGLDEIARASITTPTATPTNASAPGGVASQVAPIDTAYNVIFGYIPTEVLTLYVAVLATIHQPNKVTQAMWVTFWSFLIATPIVVWLVYGAKLKAAQKPLPLGYGSWPIWEMFAATIAYCAWAFALPNSPFLEYSWYSAALSGVIVLVASTILGLIAPFFQRPLYASGGG